MGESIGFRAVGTESSAGLCLEVRVLGTVVMVDGELVEVNNLPELLTRDGSFEILASEVYEDDDVVIGPSGGMVLT